MKAVVFEMSYGSKTYPAIAIQLKAPESKARQTVLDKAGSGVILCFQVSGIPESCWLCEQYPNRWNVSALIEFHKRLIADFSCVRDGEMVHLEQYRVGKQFEPMSP